MQLHAHFSLYTAYNTNCSSVLFNRSTRLGKGVNLRAVDGRIPPRAGIGRRIRHYRCLQLLTVGFNDLFALYHLISHGMLIAVTVMCVYGSVRTQGLMAAVLAYVSAWVLISYFQSMNNYAEVSRGSKNVLLALRACWYDGGGRSGGRSAWIIDRELVSLRELRIKGGDYAFYYDKQLTVTAMDIIFKQSASLLMLK